MGCRVNTLGINIGSRQRADVLFTTWVVLPILRGGAMRRSPDVNGATGPYRRGMDATLTMLAGMVSTAIFAGSVLPMLHKALRTRDMSSYSLGNIAMANVGNAVHSVYVFNLPAGPIWLLHTFYVFSSALMFCWYLRWRPMRRTPVATRELPRTAAAVGSPR